MKIYKCNTCGNIIVKLINSDVLVNCCGSNMELLVPNISEASKEKHIPVILKDEKDNTIIVGETHHPMDENHYIEFIIIETKLGFEVKYLKPGNEPKMTFNTNEEIINVYAYCNLHGLWKNS